MLRIIRNNSFNGNAGKLICSKEVGKCTLENAIVVPNDSVSQIQSNLNNYVNPGCSRDVRLIIDNNYYNCSLLYANSKDRNEPSLQFRYTRNSELKNKLKQIFLYSYNKLIEKNVSLNNNSVYCDNNVLRSDLKEGFSIYSTDKKDVFLLKYSNVYDKIAA